MLHFVKVTINVLETLYKGCCVSLCSLCPISKRKTKINDI